MSRRRPHLIIYLKSQIYEQNKNKKNSNIWVKIKHISEGSRKPPPKKIDAMRNKPISEREIIINSYALEKESASNNKDASNPKEDNNALIFTR